MKRTLNLLGGLLIFASGILFLWGFYDLFWTGNLQWVYNSCIMMALALGLLLWVNFFGDGMKPFLNIVGIILILIGSIFFLQGINVLPGSYMTGDPQWAINGGIMILITIGLVFWINRRK